ncbi:MAG: glycosyltransferase family 2 protein [Planctomycetaceae bacterium]|nr:glycosyltransferase family 2 protein [Planctomycetaceae bacterium]
MSGSPVPDVSVVIPVYNGSTSIVSVVERVLSVFADTVVQIVLVNDGSTDNSEQVCESLAAAHPKQIVFVQLARNFGEHNAVMCGLHHTTGRNVAVMDDDAQNPPEELPAMLRHLADHRLDVVYGRYVERKHSWWRRAGSYLNDRMAIIMLRKPADLYLSSFKVMSRFLVDRITEYRGPFPYIDGLIFRATSRIDQIDVRHDQRHTGASGYTFRKLVSLWLNMFLGFSILPLRLSVLLGFFVSALSLIGLIAVVIDKLWINPTVTVGIPTILIALTFFSGVQLIVLGTIGEYVGRVFLSLSGKPLYVTRYVCSEGARDE